MYLVFIDLGQVIDAVSEDNHDKHVWTPYAIQCLTQQQRLNSSIMVLALIYVVGAIAGFFRSWLVMQTRC